VLPIGGLKEKILAAHRGKVKTIIIPQENEKDLREIRENILKDVKIKLVDHMDEVLEAAIESDGPVIQSLVIPPAALPMGEELGTNVN
jgi:ATP-dependent Lon protease